MLEQTAFSRLTANLLGDAAEVIGINHCYQPHRLRYNPYEPIGPIAIVVDPLMTGIALPSCLPSCLPMPATPPPLLLWANACVLGQSISSPSTQNTPMASSENDGKTPFHLLVKKICFPLEIAIQMVHPPFSDAQKSKLQSTNNSS